METKTTPKRADVPVALTWDLTLVYPDAEAWEADFARLEAQLPAFEAFVGQLGHAVALLECLTLRDETGQLISKLYSWASLKKSEDNANSDSLGRYERIVGLYSRRSAATAFIEPQILALEAGKLGEFMASEPRLKLYAYSFEELERERAHTRSAEIEEVLAQLAETRGGCEMAFRQFNNADLKFPSIKDENGVEQELTHGKYINFLQSSDRRVREDAFKAMHGTFESWRNTLAATLGGTVKAHAAMARIRKYPSYLHLELGPRAIPTEVYTNLLATVRERLPVLHRYLRLRKKLLGLDELQMWDLYVPMIDNVEREIPFETGRDLVLKSVRPARFGSRRHHPTRLRRTLGGRARKRGQNVGRILGRLLPHAALHAAQLSGKTRIGVHPRARVGHSLHSYLSREAQPYVYSGYTIFVAEVASTLLEALLSHQMLSDARAANDERLQLYLLNQTAERFRTTLYRQTLFAEFELKIHEVVEANGALTAEVLSEIYLGINRDYYGAEVEVDDIAAIEWSRIPHFYYGYYVYQYATGISAAQSLARQILSEGAPAIERYLNFLRGGGSKTSIDLLQGAGVDMTTPDPINAAIDAFEDAIAQMETLSA